MSKTAELSESMKTTLRASSNITLTGLYQAMLRTGETGEAILFVEALLLERGVH